MAKVSDAGSKCGVDAEPILDGTDAIDDGAVFAGKGGANGGVARARCGAAQKPHGKLPRMGLSFAPAALQESRGGNLKLLAHGVDNGIENGGWHIDFNPTEGNWCFNITR